MRINAYCKMALGGAAWLLPAMALASNPAGTYTVPAQVDITSASGKVKEVVIQGAFFQLTSATAGTYGEPRCGRMYFTCAAGQEAMCALQWQDLKAGVASTINCQGFGALDVLPTATVRSESGPLGTPDVWDLGMGIQPGTYVDGKCAPARALACRPSGGAGGLGGGQAGAAGLGGRGAGGAAPGGRGGGAGGTSGLGGVAGGAATGGLGGSLATGGAGAAGGMTAAGGTNASGGTTASGGASAAGGAIAASGGASAAGGAIAATGGTNAAGGANGAGGGGPPPKEGGGGCRIAAGDSTSVGLLSFIVGAALYSVRRGTRRRRG